MAVNNEHNRAHDSWVSEWEKEERKEGGRENPGI